MSYTSQPFYSDIDQCYMVECQACGEYFEVDTIDAENVLENDNSVYTECPYCRETFYLEKD